MATHNTNKRSDFMETCMTRVKNLFDSQINLISESINQLGYLKDENAKLKKEVEILR